jgi:hypothetical protein
MKEIFYYQIWAGLGFGIAALLFPFRGERAKHKRLVFTVLGFAFALFAALHYLGIMKL